MTQPDDQLPKSLDVGIDRLRTMANTLVTHIVWEPDASDLRRVARGARALAEHAERLLERRRISGAGVTPHPGPDEPSDAERKEHALPYPLMHALPYPPMDDGDTWRALRFWWRGSPLVLVESICPGIGERILARVDLDKAWFIDPTPFPSGGEHVARLIVTIRASVKARESSLEARVADIESFLADLIGDIHPEAISPISEDEAEAIAMRIHGRVDERVAAASRRSRDP